MLCNFKQYRSVLLLLVIILTLGFIPMIGSADAGITIYVSVNGDDNNDGSIEMPFKTISKAKDAVRQINKDMNSDINVIIEDGIYDLEDTLQFDANDSGTNGFNIIYKAKEGANPVVSGGRRIEGWTKGENGIWSAKADQFEYMISLYVNDRQTIRARTEKKLVGTGVYNENGISGITIKKDLIGPAADSEDVEIHWTIEWQSLNMRTGGVYELEGEDNVLLGTPLDGWQRQLPWYGKPFYLENRLYFLDTQGEFYFDRKTKTVYYMPYDDEDMTTAVVYAPMLEKLMDIRSTLDNKVKNIQFKGLTFAYGTWYHLCTYGSWSANQSNWMNAGGGVDFYPAPGTSLVPANIQLECVENIDFYDNVFRGLGCVGIGMYNGVNNCEVIGNVFADILDAAMTVGLPNQFLEDKDIEGVNVALNKPVTVSSQYDGYYTGSKAVDGLPMYIWLSNPSDQNPWLQIDLQEEYLIDRIEIPDRPDADMPEARKDFEVQASNDPSFRSYEVIASCIAEFPRNTTWVAEVEPTEKYRYLRFYKTKPSIFQIAELNIMSKSANIPKIKEACRDNIIKNNIMTRIATQHWASPALQVYFGENLEISNNHIYNVPYSGICVGWWHTDQPNIDSPLKNNKILNNRVEDVMQECSDGGAIYTLGVSPGTIVKHNYISGQNNPNAMLYADQTSRYIKFEENVVEDGLRPIYVWLWDIFDNDFANNFLTSGSIVDRGVNTRIYGTQYFVEGNPPPKAKEIIEKSGVEDAYKDNYKKIPSTKRVPYGVEPYISHYGFYSNNGFRGVYLLPRLDAAKLTLKLIQDESMIWQYDPAKIEALQALVDEIEDIVPSLYNYEDIPRLEKYFVNLRESTQDLVHSFKFISLEYSQQLADEIISNDKYLENTKLKLKSDLTAAQRIEDETERSDFLRQAIRDAMQFKLRYVIDDVSLPEQAKAAVIDEENTVVHLTVKEGTDLKALKPNFMLPSSMHLVDEKNEYDFTQPVFVELTDIEGKNTAKWEIKADVEVLEVVNQDDGVINLNRFLEDPKKWSTTEGDIKIDKVLDGIRFFASGEDNICYQDAKFGDGMVRFEVKPEIGTGRFRLSLRNLIIQNIFGSYTHNYFLSFYPDRIEVGRYDDGKLTSFYGNFDDKNSLLGSIKNEDIYKFGEYSTVEFGTFNTESGVRIILIVNGEKLCDFVDTSKDCIKEPGYLGLEPLNTYLTLRPTVAQ